MKDALFELSGGAKKYSGLSYSADRPPPACAFVGGGWRWRRVNMTERMEGAARVRMIR